MKPMQFGAIEVSRLCGFKGFMRLAFRMLIKPSIVYKNILNEKKEYFQVPAATASDVFSVMVFAFEHLQYGKTFIYKGELVRMKDASEAIAAHNEQVLKLQAFKN